jgi:argininosuccinate lyase
MSKLWQTTGSKLCPAIEKYTVGKDYLNDQRLVKYDCLASIAHVKMLKKIGILKKTECEKLVDELNRVMVLDKKKQFRIKSGEEDCHTAIENHLTKKLSQIGKKVHTARSRNDQVLVALRLYSLAQTDQAVKSTGHLIKTIRVKAKGWKKITMPGYTHTQPAMPTTVGIWLSSFADSLADDLKLMAAVASVIDQNPLGSAAGFGQPVIPIDRKFTTRQLGFGRLQSNPIYCANSRGKFENLILQSYSQVMLDLGKLANDLVWFTAQEFDFFDLPENFKTGSSAMPQKNNFDVLELIRGNTSLFLGYQFQVQEITKNLFSGYNRDYQLTKMPYFSATDLLLETLEIFQLVILNLKIKPEKLKAACGPQLDATSKAYKLVLAGMAFRDAYQKIKQDLNK